MSGAQDMRQPVLLATTEKGCRLLVVDQNGVPVAGAHVQTARYGEPGAVIGSSDGAGCVELAEQVWGQPAAVAHERFQPTFLQLPKQSGRYSVVLEAGAAVSVQVSCGGDPVAGASVRLASGRVPLTWRKGVDQILPRDSGGIVMWRDTDAQGFVRLTNIPTGAYSVVATKVGYTCRANQRQQIELPGSGPVNIEMEQLWGAIVDLGEEALELSFEYDGLDVFHQEVIGLRQQFGDAEIVVAGARKGTDRGSISATYYGVESGAWMKAHAEFAWLQEPKLSVAKPVRGDPVGAPGILSTRVLFRDRELQGIRFSLLRDENARVFALSGKPRPAIPGVYQVELSDYAKVVDFDASSVTIGSDLTTELRGRVRQGVLPLRINVPSAALDPNGCIVNVVCGEYDDRDVYDPGRWYMLLASADLTVKVERYGVGAFERHFSVKEWQDRAGDVLRVEAP